MTPARVVPARPLSLLRWLLLGRGMLASNVPEAMAFASSNGDSAPDLELSLMPIEWRKEGLEPPPNAVVAMIAERAGDLLAA